MLEVIGDIYARLVGWPALTRLHRAAYYLSGRAIGLYNYSSMAVSGERKVIKHVLASVPKPIVFDVGANEGRWSEAVLDVCPRAVIHAFEPQRGLADRIRHRANMTVNCVAVGSRSGSLELFDYADREGTSHASVVPGVIEQIHHGESRSISVPVTTIDEYCRDKGIEIIDLLKIDVEGFEMEVLTGASRMLREGRVGAVQFEFTSANAMMRRFVDDFVKLLSGYSLHRILTHGLLPLRAGDHWINEQFAYQNILAIRIRNGGA